MTRAYVPPGIFFKNTLIFMYISRKKNKKYAYIEENLQFLPSPLERKFSFPPPSVSKSGPTLVV
jgi:uncharacterized protein YcgL (UPF0745 family)